MIGCYDFCGHYEWTFAWMQQQGGHEAVRAFWDEAIHRDSQRHAARLIAEQGIEGMKQYWGVTLEDEGGTHHCTATAEVFRIDMHECPSKGFLLRNGLEQYRDYCDHCMGWIGPLMKEAGYVIDHEHNHCGQCWWEMRAASAEGRTGAIGDVSGAHDVRLRSDWAQAHTDHYDRANDPDQKNPPP
jgi:hypothetical protein